MRREKQKRLLKSDKNEQLKLDSFPSEAVKKIQTEEKQIIITKLNSTLVWDELLLEIEFQLVPNKNHFSKIKAALWFDQEKTRSILFDIMQSFNITDEFTLKVTLDLKEIPEGQHSVKVEIYELWEFIEKHENVKKEIIFEYTPETKKANLRKIPIIKRIEGEGVAVISDSEKDVYREIQETMKQEVDSKRDKW